MARLLNAEWDTPANTDGTYNWPVIMAAVLMDIRAELRTIARILQCRNTQQIPHILRQIADQTKRRRKPKLRVVKRRRDA